MPVDDLYAAHVAAPTPQTLDALLVSVRQMATRMVGRAISRTSEREDVVSDAVINVWRSMSSPRDQAVPYSAWVRSIMKRRIADHIRRTYKRPILYGVDGPTLDANAPESRPGALHDVQGIQGLTPAQRTLLTRFVQQPDYSALAESLGMRPATLRNKLNRLRKKITAMRVAVQ